MSVFKLTDLSGIFSIDTCDAVKLALSTTADMCAHIRIGIQSPCGEVKWVYYAKYNARRSHRRPRERQDLSPTTERRSLKCVVSPAVNKQSVYLPFMTEVLHSQPKRPPASFSVISSAASKNINLILLRTFITNLKRQKLFCFFFAQRLRLFKMTAQQGHNKLTPNFRCKRLRRN